MSTRCKTFSSQPKPLRKRRPARRAPPLPPSASLIARDLTVLMKVKKLQKLIPGGRGLQPDRLLSRTADYILHLRSQVDVLQALSKIYGHK
ncbi:transcription factor IBH1-like [Rhodamnia argentea]|uniref:Transcription factor IBH1-like n=1 Tax=Rhodamnia argentea TaxID=178133 RepID=A0ABM3HJL5_9MYRT|nr:transcription factor IBH1-like [Rhodamnia argentea]